MALSKADREIRLVTVFETGDVGVAALVDATLEQAGIDHAMRGDALRSVVGWGGSGVFNSAVHPVTFEVREEDAARAAEVLAALESASDEGA